MIIFGIDPGLATVGYGIIDKAHNQRITLVDYGIISTPKDFKLPDRLVIIEEALNTLFDRHRPEVIAVEELFFAKNVKTAMVVAQARGVIMLTARKFCGKLYEYTPLQVKSALTGYGQAEKTQIQLMVKMMLNMTKLPGPDDAADALALAITHARTSVQLNTNFI
ncbi:MAG: crossover junction endodeoxyribonuclease RuvC [Clostridiales bacterium]|nr:crossover junction endodeoxyribonuclease RuvC [Clostridiales bacterium]